MADIEELKPKHPDEWAIFDALDVDSGGTLDKDELWCKLAVNGEEAATQMIAMVDLNGDGVVDFDGPSPAPRPSPLAPPPVQTTIFCAARLSAPLGVIPLTATTRLAHHYQSFARPSTATRRSNRW
eukprot:SAG22_NODE_2525_length_2476_cov_1.147244_2_plen_126_part_00